MRRQIEEADEFAKKELKLPIDEQFADKGISGRKLRNATHGALGLFLSKIRSGEIVPGSVLIVENLNRLSRAEPRSAFKLLDEIVEAGVEVVTLHDRRRYNHATMREIGHLIQALVIMTSSWQESENKAVWLADAWKEKRDAAIASGRPMTRQVPAWLRVVGVRKAGQRFDWSDAKFEVVEERAEVVREIFRLRAGGWGRRRIAAALNDRGEEVWGTGKRKAEGGWQESYIHKLLVSRAVMGEYQPHKLKEGRYSPRIPVGDPIPGFYPEIVSPALWHSAQVKHAVKPARGRPSGSLLTGLLIDPDGNPMHVERKGDNCDYFATARAFRRKGRIIHRWKMVHLEKCVLEIAAYLIDWRRVNRDDSRAEELRELRGKLGELQREEVQIKAKTKAAAKLVVDQLGEFSEALREQVEALNNRMVDVRIAIAETEGAIQLAQGIPTNADALVADLKGDVTDPEVRSRINAELRRLLKQIQIWPTGDCPRISRADLEESRQFVAAALKGNRGIGAKANGQLVGAIELVFPSGRRFSSLWTHRPRSRDPKDWQPVCHGWPAESSQTIYDEKQALSTKHGLVNQSPLKPSW